MYPIQISYTYIIYIYHIHISYTYIIYIYHIHISYTYILYLLTFTLVELSLDQILTFSSIQHDPSSMNVFRLHLRSHSRSLEYLQMFWVVVLCFFYQSLASIILDCALFRHCVLYNDLLVAVFFL